MSEKIKFKIHLSNGKIYNLSEESNQSLKLIIENIFQKKNILFKINNALLNGKELILNKTISENDIKKYDIINNYLGICPRQILTETVSISKLKSRKKFQRDLKSDLYFYFTTKNELYYSVFENQKDLTKNIQIWNNNNLKDSTIFKFNKFEINMPNYYNKSEYLNILYKHKYFYICNNFD